MIDFQPHYDAIAAAKHSVSVAANNLNLANSMFAPGAFCPLLDSAIRDYENALDAESEAKEAFGKAHDEYLRQLDIRCGRKAA